jgi:hypothetical protein
VLKDQTHRAPATRLTHLPKFLLMNNATELTSIPCPVYGCPFSGVNNRVIDWQNASIGVGSYCGRQLVEFASMEHQPLQKFLNSIKHRCSRRTDTEQTLNRHWTDTEQTLNRHWTDTGASTLPQTIVSIGWREWAENGREEATSQLHNCWLSTHPHSLQPRLSAATTTNWIRDKNSIIVIFLIMSKLYCIPDI